MLKVIKIAAVAMIVFALTANLHTALFTFYGIKTGNLDGAVWANSLSTTDNTSGTSTDGTSSDDSWWNTPVYSTVHCGTMQFSQTTSNHGAISVSYTTNAQTGQVSISVSFGAVTSGTVTGTVAAHDATMKQCIGPADWVYCSNITASEACL